MARGRVEEKLVADNEVAGVEVQAPPWRSDDTKWGYGQIGQPGTSVNPWGPGGGGGSYAKWVPLIGREPAPMTANYEVAVQQHRFDLLLKDGALVALIETVDEGDRLLIENVAVASGLQGQGLGQMLLAHAEHLARDLGKTRIRL